MEDLGHDPFFTHDRAWGNTCVPCINRFKTTLSRGKHNEEEVIKDNRIYGPKFARDKNIYTFNKACKIVQYENGELFTAFLKTFKNTHKDTLNNLVNKMYMYHSVNIPGKEMTAAVKEALERQP